MKILRIAPLILLVSILLFMPNLSFITRANNALHAEPQTGSGNHSMLVTWNASVVDTTHIAPTGYNVKRALIHGGPYTTIGSVTTLTALSFTDANVTAGTTYFYVVTGTCSTCTESAPSIEASATIPLDQINPPTGLAVVPK